MKCVFCKKEISPEDNYHKDIEMKERKKISVTYFHETCWKEFTNQVNGAKNSLKQSNYLLNGLGNHMRKMGILPEQEVEIIC